MYLICFAELGSLKLLTSIDMSHPAFDNILCVSMQFFFKLCGPGGVLFTSSLVAGNRKGNEPFSETIKLKQRIKNF